MTYVSDDVLPQLFALLKELHGGGVLRDAFLLSVDALKQVGQVDRCHGGVGYVRLHVVLLGLEVELFDLPWLFALFLVLVLAGRRLGCRGGGHGRRSPRRRGDRLLVVFEGIVSLPDDLGLLLGDDELALGEFLGSVSRGQGYRIRNVVVRWAFGSAQIKAPTRASEMLRAGLDRADRPCRAWPPAPCHAYSYTSKPNHGRAHRTSSGLRGPR
jgi:hypothetical protein